MMRQRTPLTRSPSLAFGKDSKAGRAMRCQMSKREKLIADIADQKRRFQTIILSHEQADLFVWLLKSGELRMAAAKEDILRFQLETLSREALIDELIGALTRVADLAAKPSATRVTIERIKNRF